MIRRTPHPPAFAKASAGRPAGGLGKAGRRSLGEGGLVPLFATAQSKSTAVWWTGMKKNGGPIRTAVFANFVASIPRRCALRKIGAIDGWRTRSGDSAYDGSGDMRKLEPCLGEDAGSGQTAIEQ